MTTGIQNVFLGVDVGSVSTNFVLLDPHKPLEERVVWKTYLRTQGAPLTALKKGLQCMDKAGQWKIVGVGTTGSGRELAGRILGADVIKNEITAHAVAALEESSEVQTIIEIGGQDSKLILIQDGVVKDFAMNTVCAAGTGSFLDQQAARLALPIEEFGPLALESKNPVRIAGRCTVFAESDMIHKQQLGHSVADILAGLCEAMVRNYLVNVAKGKDLQSKVFFQGGVAANMGMRHYLAKAIRLDVHVPQHFDVMGALGAAYLAYERLSKAKTTTAYMGRDILDSSFYTRSFECDRCSNHCEIIELWRDEKILANWGARCGRLT